MADYLKSKAPNAVIFDTTASDPVQQGVVLWVLVAARERAGRHGSFG